MIVVAFSKYWCVIPNQIEFIHTNFFISILAWTDDLVLTLNRCSHNINLYLLYYSDNLPIELSEIGQWWGTDPKKKKQIQIDIVGTPVSGKDYIIGSCKYRNEKIGVDELDLIRDYASVFGKGNNYHYYIFSKGRFTDGLLQAQERGEVQLITLEDIYK